MMAAAVTILYSTVQILLNDFVNIYSRCASVKLDADLMQQVYSAHAKTSAKHFVCTMLQNESDHSTMRMFRSFKEFLACNIAVIINCNERNLWRFTEVRPQLAVVCWNRYLSHICLDFMQSYSNKMDNLAFSCYFCM